MKIHWKIPKSGLFPNGTSCGMKGEAKDDIKEVSCKRCLKYVCMD